MPALLAVSPYGKHGHGKLRSRLGKRPLIHGTVGFRIFDNIPFRLGLPESATSGLEKFEGLVQLTLHMIVTDGCRPDPVEWCPRGYAIVNVDIRGSWESEGDLYIEGSQMGESYWWALFCHS